MRDIVAALFEIPEDAPHLEQALTHPSFANEVRHAPDNQRLEFLGDAVLGLCTSQLLFERYPDADEGTLTRLRAQIVNTERLAEWGRAQGVAEAIRLGRGALTSGLRESTNVVADAVEACIAAAYLDGGLVAARAACARIVEPILEQLGQSGSRDPKSELQEYVQSRGLGLPIYDVCESGGPAHDRWFEVRVNVAGNWLAKGRGRSKRLAERAAAEELLQHRDELIGAVERPRDTTPDAAPDTMQGVTIDNVGIPSGPTGHAAVMLGDEGSLTRDTLVGDTPPFGTSIAISADDTPAPRGGGFAGRDRPMDTWSGDTPARGTPIDRSAGDLRGRSAPMDTLVSDTPARGTPIDILVGDTPASGTPIDILVGDTPASGTPIDILVGDAPAVSGKLRTQRGSSGNEGVDRNVESRSELPPEFDRTEGKR